MRKVITAAAAGTMVLGMAYSALATIAGTPHDLSVGSGGVEFNTDRVCVFCHYPHNANPAVPLWNHTLSTSTYDLYTSSTIDSDYAAGITPPTGVSLSNTSSGLCLSCHDGTVAVNSVNTGPSGITEVVSTGGGVIDATTYAISSTVSVYIGTDLTNDHPVDIIYRGSSDDPDLNDPSTVICTNAATGQDITVQDLLRPGNNGLQNTVQCTSCHEPHKSLTADTDICGNSYTGASKNFMRIDLAGSLLCYGCHNK